MPALVLCNRKWLLASDDLIFSSITETIIRAIWIPIFSAAIYIHMRDKQECEQANYVSFILFLLLIDCILSAFLCGIITWISSRGSIIQNEKRSFIPWLTYMKLILFALEIMVTIPITWFIFTSCNLKNECVNPDIITYLKVISVVSWIYIGIIFIIIILSYDPVGSSNFWKNEQLTGENTRKHLKKSKKTWENRLKFLFCCLSSNKRNRLVYRDIADFLAKFCKDVDLVPTDVLSGLIILSKKHTAEKRRLTFLDSICVNGSVSPNAYGLPADGIIPFWMNLENALHFLQLAKSTYLIFQDTCNLCVSTPHLNCCRKNDIAETDAGCFCNKAALQNVNGFNSEDTLYVSYHNAIHEPSFFVVVDREKSSIVIGIRGTLSLADFVTDIDGEYEKMQDCFSREFYCHRGTLKSAKYIYEKINELKILKTAFAEFPDFKLVATGHSLGGSTAVVLCFMLKAEYPDLQCYTYGPLAILSSAGTKLTYNFVYTVVVGDDLSPRLCVRSCMDLKNDVINCVQECKTQKYKLLLGAFSRFFLKVKLFHTEQKVENFKSFDEILKDNNETNEKFADLFDKTERLYAAGRILYLECVDNRIRSCWKTGFHFRRLIITPRNARDHQPRRIQKMLEHLKDERSKSYDIDIVHQNETSTLENSFCDENMHVI